MTVYYLEYVEENHQKFYEITVEQQSLKLRFGKIGATGTQQAKDYSSSAIAQKEAEKKLREKQKKGYQIRTSPAIADFPTQAKVVTSSSPELAGKSVTANQNSGKLSPIKPQNHFPLEPFTAPLEWRFASGFSSFGLAVEQGNCWLGNEKGQVLKFDEKGAVLERYQLPRAVKSIVTDDIWVYGGCDNGMVYDMTGKIPYLAYEIESAADILGLTITAGILGVSDAQGGLTKIDPEGDMLWQRFSLGKQGWMICSDSQGFYQGHSKGLTMYEFDQGRQLWQEATVGKVLFGCQAADSLYVATSGRQVQCFQKSGQLIASYHCDASVYACAIDEARGLIYAADSSAFIYAFNHCGQRLWKASTGCGSALSMQLGGVDTQKLYLATNQGVLACMVVNESALWKAIQGQFTHSVLVANPEVIAATPGQDLEKTNHPTGEILLECFRQDQRLRVRVVSPGYHRDWMVQFPRNLRQEGHRYLVQSLYESSQGFYRLRGDIKRLV
jgi:outer membrane protein assembly factor BamB